MLWVITVIRILKQTLLKEPFCAIVGLKAQLESLPMEFADLYSHMISRLLKNFGPNHEGNLAKARRILMWVSVSSQYTFQLQDLLQITVYNFEGPSNEPKVLLGSISWPQVKI